VTVSELQTIAWTSIAAEIASAANMRRRHINRATRHIVHATAKFALLLGILHGATAAPNRNAIPAAPTTICALRFDMNRWSAVFRYAEGKGVIRCDNGQVMYVSVHARGGGLTSGNARIRNGVGNFSEISDINQLIGIYRGIPGGAGTFNSARANVVTNGNVSLLLARAGAGWDLGVTAGRFEIHRLNESAVARR
jgi:hypothetical protein